MSRPDPAHLARLCNEATTLGRPLRLWPFRIWFSVDRIGRPVERPLSGAPYGPSIWLAKVERHFCFRREYGGGPNRGKIEVRHLRFRKALWSTIRPRISPMRRPRHLLVMAAAYAGFALLHAIGRPGASNSIMACVWMACAFYWIRSYRRSTPS